MGIIYTSSTLGGTSLPEVNFPLPSGTLGLLLTNNSVWDLTVFSPLWNLTVPSYSVATMPASGNLQITVKGLSKDTTLIALSNASVSWGSSNVSVPLNISPIASKAVVPIQITSGTVDVTIQNATLDTHSTVQNDLLKQNPSYVGSPQDFTLNGTTNLQPLGITLPAAIYDAVGFVLYSPSGNVNNFTLAWGQARLNSPFSSDPSLSPYVTLTGTPTAPPGSQDLSANLGWYTPITLSINQAINMVVINLTSSVATSETIQIIPVARYASSAVAFDTADDSVAELFINDASPNTAYYLGGNTSPTTFSKPVRAIRLQGLMASGTTTYALLLTFTDTSENELAQFQTFMNASPSGGMSLDFPRGYWPGTVGQDYYVYISGGSAGSPNFTTVGEMIY